MVKEMKFSDNRFYESLSKSCKYCNWLCSYSFFDFRIGETIKYDLYYCTLHYKFIVKNESNTHLGSISLGKIVDEFKQQAFELVPYDANRPYFVALMYAFKQGLVDIKIFHKITFDKTK